MQNFIETKILRNIAIIFIIIGGLLQMPYFDDSYTIGLSKALIQLGVGGIFLNIMTNFNKNKQAVNQQMMKIAALLLLMISIFFIYTLFKYFK